MLAKFELYHDRGGRWRWRLLSESGEVIAASARGHADAVSAVRQIELVKRIAVLGAPIPIVEELAAEPTSAGPYSRGGRLRRRSAGRAMHTVQAHARPRAQTR